jgi:hypothetical protein
MTHLRVFVFLLISAAFAFGQKPQNGNPSSPPKQALVLAQKFYREVVARHPTGLPSGADRSVFTPYLSKRLLERIDLAKACADDWVRQDRKRMSMKDQVPEKAPFGWAEAGVFSGPDERTEPDAFFIERAESEQDGSIRVYVRLTLSSPPPETWGVAAVLVRERGRLVVDDVIYLRDKSDAADVWLSKLLSHGCNGSRWVGFVDGKDKQ